MLDTETHWNPIRASAGRRVVAAESHWILPAKWNAAAERDGVRRRVLCGAAGDLFEDWDDVLYRQNGDIVIRDYQSALSRVQMPASMRDIRRRVFETIDATPWIDWIVTTKWPQNVRRRWGGPTNTRDFNPCDDRSWHRSNVWFLANVSDQHTADALIPSLLECRDLVPVLGLSCELVGPVNLTPWLERLDWVRVGGESGPNARPCDITWIRSIVDQCLLAGVPCFVKQLGSMPIIQDAETNGVLVALDLRDKSGSDPAEWPADLRVREYPEVRQ